MKKIKSYRSWTFGQGAYSVPATPINWDACTTVRVDKRKGAGLTLAKIRQAVKKLKASDKRWDLPCGCTPYLRADNGIFLLTNAECRKHND